MTGIPSNARGQLSLYGSTKPFNRFPNGLPKRPRNKTQLPAPSHSPIVFICPHRKTPGSSGDVFQRHSRTVIVRRCKSMVITSNASRVSSFDETDPFIGESTRKQGNEIFLSGPCHS